MYWSDGEKEKWFSLISCVISNPVNVLGDSSVNTRIAGLAALIPERNNTQLHPAGFYLHHQWTSRITWRGGQIRDYYEEQGSEDKTYLDKHLHRPRHTQHKGSYQWWAGNRPDCNLHSSKLVIRPVFGPSTLCHHNRSFPSQQRSLAYSIIFLWIQHAVAANKPELYTWIS